MAQIGKRLCDGSESPTEQRPARRLRRLPLIAEEAIDHASDCNSSTSKLHGSTSSSSASSPEPYFGSKQQKGLSERAKRAERRSSQEHTSTASPSNKRSTERKRDQNKLEDRQATKDDPKQLLGHASSVGTKRQFVKSSLIGSSSDDRELLIQRKKPRFGKSSHASKKKTPKPLDLHKALEELRAAEAALTPATPQFLLSPTVENNIFARQASMSQLPATAPSSPHTAGETLSNYKPPAVEDKNVKDAKAKATLKSLSPVVKNTDINDDASFLAFNRRLSASARKLAKGDYKTPESGNTSLSEESLTSDELNDITTTAGATAQQAQLLLQTLTGMVKRQQEITEVTEQRLMIDSQRIATQWATQPPAAMTPAELYKFAQTALEQGADHAIRVLQSVNGNHDPNNQPLLFNNKPIEYNRRRISPFDGPQSQSLIPMSLEDMYYCLKADEQRYRSAFMTCRYLWRYFGGPAHRSGNPVSRYPLYDVAQKENMEAAKRLQEAEILSRPPSTRYGAFNASTTTGFGPSLLFPNTLEDVRRPSWEMEIDTKTRSESKPSNTATWNNTFGIVFADPATAQPQQGSVTDFQQSNKNICSHFLKGNCRWGDACNKSHDTNATASNPVLLTRMTRELNVHLENLLTSLQPLQGLTHISMQIDDRIAMLARHLDWCCQAINRTITFMSSEELLQSNLRLEKFQSLPNSLNCWWMGISGEPMPFVLNDAVENINIVIVRGNQKMTRAPGYVTQTNFSNVNHFQGGGNQNSSNGANKSGFQNDGNQNPFQNGGGNAFQSESQNPFQNGGRNSGQNGGQIPTQNNWNNNVSKSGRGNRGRGGNGNGNGNQRSNFNGNFGGNRNNNGNNNGKYRAFNGQTQNGNNGGNQNGGNNNRGAFGGNRGTNNRSGRGRGRGSHRN